jgi:peptidoglycan hydrolase CwlO-like protein
MKKFLLAMLTLFMINSVYSQNVKTDSLVSPIEYPKLETDSNGVRVVVMTLEQAAKLDNKLDLLKLLEDYKISVSNLDSIFVRVIVEKDKIIAMQSFQISKMSELLDNKDSQIENLRLQISNYVLKEITYESELRNNKKEIDIHLKRIRNLENKVLWGGIGSGFIIVATTVFAIISSK